MCLDLTRRRMGGQSASLQLRTTSPSCLLAISPISVRPADGRKLIMLLISWCAVAFRDEHATWNMSTIYDYSNTFLPSLHPTSFDLIMTVWSISVPGLYFFNGERSNESSIARRFYYTHMAGVQEPDGYYNGMFFRPKLNDSLRPWELWAPGTITLDFPKYFSLCAPLSCTYYYSGVPSAIQLFTTVLGIIGGVTTVLYWSLRVVPSPLLVRLCCSRPQPSLSDAAAVGTSTSGPKRTVHWASPDEPPLTAHQQHQQHGDRDWPLNAVSATGVPLAPAGSDEDHDDIIQPSSSRPAPSVPVFISDAPQGKSWVTRHPKIKVRGTVVLCRLL
jgi:hypothetical protein